jgi:hypothetical protein
MIEQLKEVTGTVDGFRYPENMYYVDKKTGKLVAFYPEGNPDGFKIFTRPLKFDKKRRKFETIAVTNGL